MIFADFVGSRYGSDTWLSSMEDVKRLEWIEGWMAKWMYGTPISASVCGDMLCYRSTIHPHLFLCSSF